MKERNKQQFKKDFNSESNIISNDELIKKYGFNNNKEMFSYAHNNNLIIVKKHTEEEERNLNLMSKELKECMNLLK